MPTKSLEKLVVVWRETGREACELGENMSSRHHGRLDLLSNKNEIYYQQYPGQVLGLD